MDVFDILYAVLVLINVMLSPYTKVEESFNLQATHDLLLYGPTNLEQYDHFQFPGVVPRTFIGSIILSISAYPVMFMHKFVDPKLDNKFILQIIVRINLGLFIAYCLSRFRRAVRQVFGGPAANAIGILQCCQFHGLFWSSRTLPNTFAYGIVTLAFGAWISSTPSAPLKPREVKDMMRSLKPEKKVGNEYQTPCGVLRCLQLITAAGVIFRSELVALLVPICAIEYLRGRLQLHTAAKLGIKTTTVALATTVLIDSYFWQTFPMWPEGNVFYFNTVLGKSQEWGTSPFYTYFFNFLPRLLGIAYPLAAYGYATDTRVRPYVLPMILFTLCMSFLGHKEWRFVIYVVPILNMAAGVGYARLKTRSGKSTFARIAYRGTRHAAVVTFCLTIAMGLVSRLNYPGGHALTRVHKLQKDSEEKVFIHLDAFTAMTGASRFGEKSQDRNWIYSKNESHRYPNEYTRYTHLLTSTPEIHGLDFDVMDTIYGYDRVNVDSPRMYVGRIGRCVRKPILCLLRDQSDQTIKEGAHAVSTGKFALPTRVFWNLMELLPVRIVRKPKVWVMKKKDTAV